MGVDLEHQPLFVDTRDSAVGELLAGTVGIDCDITFGLYDTVSALAG